MEPDEPPLRLREALELDELLPRDDVPVLLDELERVVELGFFVPVLRDDVPDRLVVVRAVERDAVERVVELGFFVPVLRDAVPERVVDRSDERDAVEREDVPRFAPLPVLAAMPLLRVVRFFFAPALRVVSVSLALLLRDAEPRALSVFFAAVPRELVPPREAVERALDERVPEERLDVERLVVLVDGAFCAPVDRAELARALVDRLPVDRVSVPDPFAVVCVDAFLALDRAAVFLPSDDRVDEPDWEDAAPDDDVDDFLAIDRGTAFFAAVPSKGGLALIIFVSPTEAPG